MREDPYFEDRATFLYSMLVAPFANAMRVGPVGGYERTFGLFQSYSFIEGFLWMRLGHSLGYLSTSSVEQFLSSNTGYLISAYLTIQSHGELFQRVDFNRWCDFFDINLKGEESAPGVSVNRERFLNPMVLTDTSPLMRTEFQNLFMLASEIVTDELTELFLRLLNFSDDRTWENVIAGRGGERFPLSVHQMCSTVVNIVAFLEEFAPDYRDVWYAKTNSINRPARENQMWKFNFADATITNRFLQAADITRRQVAMDDFGRRGGTVALMDFDKTVASLMERWNANTFANIDPEAFRKERERKIRSRDRQLDKSIEELELSVTAYNALRNFRVDTVRDLIGLSERDLLSRGKFGRKTLNEIKEALATMGLGLGAVQPSYVSDLPIEHSEKEWDNPDFEEEK